MSDSILVEKDISQPKQVPSSWRVTLTQIVDAINEGDYQLLRGIPNVSILSASIAEVIQFNIESYGMPLVSLPDETWHSSVCFWMRGHWDVFIDLFTKDGVSDLILSLRVEETSEGYAFTPHLVYVP
jgi:hypothetical protein